jgi:hypothetical protein
MKSILTLVCLSLTVMAQPAPEAQAPTVPKEVRMTVESLAGHWTFHGTDVETGAHEPATVAMEFDCQSAALGRAVVCRLTGNVSGFGQIEAASVVGYNPEEKLVHWMEISSTEEYHDHKGPWEENGIGFEPLVCTVAGKKCTETFSLAFPSPDKMILKSVTKTPAGASRIEGIAIRQ